MALERDTVADLEERIARLERMLSLFMRGDRFVFPRTLYLNEGVDIVVSGNGAGTKIGTSSTEKLAFWGETPITQFEDPQGRSDIDGNSSGTNMTTGHRFNGNTGSDYYSVGDIVYALKTLGILKNQ